MMVVGGLGRESQFLKCVSQDVAGCYTKHWLASWSKNVGNSGLNLVKMFISLQKMLES